MDEAMRVTLPCGDLLWLPPNGYFGCTCDEKVLTYSGLIDGHRVDYVSSPEYVFLDARGKETSLGGVSTNKVCVQTADGKRTVVIEETVNMHEWRAICADLRPWAKESVWLVLIADCGPKNNTYGDWAVWGDCRLTTE